MVKKFFSALRTLFKKIFQTFQNPTEENMSTMALAYLRDNKDFYGEPEIYAIKQISRVMHDTGRLIDSNIYFSVWAIFTPDRIIIAKNKMEFSVFVCIEKNILCDKENWAIVFIENKIEVRSRLTKEKYIFYFEGPYKSALPVCKKILATYMSK